MSQQHLVIFQLKCHVSISYANDLQTDHWDTTAVEEGVLK